jgi:lipopolysaccharide transport system permease protein
MMAGVANPRQPETAAPVAGPTRGDPDRRDVGGADVPELVIEPSRGWRGLGLKELWAYRELLLFFVWRDVKLRYAQTALGVAWTVAQPVMMMIVFSLFFGRLAGMPSDGVPYPLFTFAALVPWTFFATGVAKSASSLVVHQGLLTKIYFPRLALPAASVLAGLVDLAISLVLLVGMLAFFGIAPQSGTLWLPPLLLLCCITTLGAGLWLGALNVRYRDVQQALPFVVQIWLFATPVVYPSSLLDGPWRTLYGLNPMAGVVEGFRWAILHRGPPPAGMILLSTFTAVALLLGGAFVFRRMERSFADVV